jgi:hypothetical protein
MEHTATWAQNTVVFSVEPSGITFNFSQEPLLPDWDMQEAALAQLETAYGLEISYPESESTILMLFGVSTEEILNGKSLYFEWSPPLPELASEVQDIEQSLSKELKGLVELFQNGYLTAEEFTSAKAKILGV